MATIGQVIFRIMIAIIILLLAALGLIIGIGVAGKDSATVTTHGSVGLIGDAGILSCSFPPDTKQSTDVRWEKTGVSGPVYKYEKGAAALSDQSAAFKGRAALFPGQLMAGNASLKLTKLQLSDAGEYKCVISNSNGKGEGKLTLKVGGYSALEVTDVAPDTLRCRSPSWHPKPSVTWFNSSKISLVNVSTTNYTASFNDMVGVSSNLPGVQPGAQYTCVIENELARAEGDAIWTDSGVMTQTRLEVTASAAAISPPLFLLCLLSLLGPGVH
ncbi:V-set domain-containing T-cell activation inhibitor 1 [Spea bombifrons]|uniref:V-set domain-containing T-cell activation inhibitor 1 n=1 Tax=Spea bombifrons TaxID=233779 RepID=UPI00234B9193|nr:V-set domain-containing T-cell activation inhibitor 1 [Spea bombifrons]